MSLFGKNSLKRRRERRKWLRGCTARVQPNQLDGQVLRFTSSTSFSPTTSPSLSSHKLTLFSAECNCCLIYCPVSTMHRLATAQSRLLLRSHLFGPTNHPSNQSTTNPMSSGHKPNDHQSTTDTDQHHQSQPT